MLRHIKIILVVLLTASAAPAFSGAATPVETVSAQLADQGYQVETVSKTFWGRVKIVAVKDDREREVIVNPKTGEILRDLVRGRKVGQGSEGSGSGKSGGADDDKGDDADEKDSPDSDDSVDGGETDETDETNERDDPGDS